MHCLLCGQCSASTESYGIPPRPGKCPRCGSKPRHRELAWFFQRYLRGRLKKGTKVLEVGPSAAQVPNFQRPDFLGEALYTAIDSPRSKFHSSIRPPHRFLEMDVTRMTFSDQSFEIILCNHVFPYIRSDYQAMAQVHRCLKSSGLAILNVAHPLVKTKRAFEMAEENPQIYNEEYRATNGSEWVYGEDYFERLEAAGFFHHVLKLESLGKELLEEQKFRPDAELILCFKYKDVMAEFLGGL